MKTNYTFNNSDFGDVFVPENLFSTKDLWAWGQSIGNLPVSANYSNTYRSPIQTTFGAGWKDISIGNQGAAGIKTDGTLWTWGPSSFGNLGGATFALGSPVQTISGGTNWKQVSVGYASMGAIKTDGTLWLWGYNNYGQLGDGTVTDRSSPVQTIAQGTNWKQVSCSFTNTAAIKTDGTLWNWGQGSGGKLGDNTTISKSSPVQTVSGGTNWKQVSCGGGDTAAVKTDGTLWLWGASGAQLGIGVSVAQRSSPVQTISGGTNWKQVSCSANHTAAIKTDGSLWMWGSNNNGKLGDNTTITRNTPVQTIAGGYDWKQVYVGQSSNVTAAVKTDGSLWMWGAGGNGSLGNGYISDRSSPVQTIAGGYDWKYVTVSYDNGVLALKEI